MINKKYDEIVERHKPTEQRSKNSLIAFLIGGLVGAIGEGLIQIYCSIWHISRTVSSVYMIITLIFIAALATAIGFFDKWVNFARCGLLIPITGFSIVNSYLSFTHLKIYLVLLFPKEQIYHP